MAWSPIALADATAATVQGGELLMTRNSQQVIASSRKESASVNLNIDAKLRRAIKEADDYFIVGRREFQQSGKTYFIVVTQTPSRTNRSAGACGAGTEDVAHLVNVDRHRNRLIDKGKVLIQSCLNGIDLNDDTGTSLRQRLEGVVDPQHWPLAWLNHPTYGNANKTLSAVAGVLIVE
jgi:hypothetical protein